MASGISFSIIPFAEWRKEIAPLWLMEGSFKRIPPILNAHGQMQYSGRELFERVLLFPIAATLSGERIAWTSVYNISDTAVRVRGIYVNPEFRSNGIGRSMVEYAISLWPEQWSNCFMYARASNVERYARWGFRPVKSYGMRSFEQGDLFDEPGIVLVQKSRL